MANYFQNITKIILITEIASIAIANSKILKKK